MYFVKANNLLALISLTLAALSAFLTIFSPTTLYPLNKAWFNVGNLLGSIFSPIFLGFIFFILISPVAIVSRIFGRDELLLKKNEKNSTYWVKKDPVEQSLKSFKNQF